MKKIKLVISFFILALFTANAMAQTPEDQGREIAVEAKKRDTGWNDNKSVSKMILRAFSCLVVHHTQFVGAPEFVFILLVPIICKGLQERVFPVIKINFLYPVLVLVPPDIQPRIPGVFI